MQFDLEVTSQTVCDRLGDPGGVAEKRLVQRIWGPVTLVLAISTAVIAVNV
jgi:hypothetical protein